MKRGWSAVILLLALLFGFRVGAQSEKPDSVGNLIEQIEYDSIIIIDQPDGIMDRLLRPGASVERVPASQGQAQGPVKPKQPKDNKPKTVVGTAKSGGYRVQVFSDNNVRTAKSEARSMAQAISRRFPQYRTYVLYQSPYWRLRVGDFLTKTEAEKAMGMIRNAFPNYAREMRVVEDRINRKIYE